MKESKQSGGEISKEDFHFSSRYRHRRPWRHFHPPKKEERKKKQKKGVKKQKNGKDKREMKKKGERWGKSAPYFLTMLKTEKQNKESGAGGSTHVWVQTV